MSKYIILDNNYLNGTRKGVSIFYAAEIYSGTHAGKFACSENALKEFPELFDGKEKPVELDSSVFYLSEKEQLIREKAVIEEKIKAIEDKEIKPIVK
jgi:hypothetical protein